MIVVMSELGPQNIYDDAAFFAGYSKLERFGQAFGRAFEHGAFLELLPVVEGKRVLDLGCGAGQLSHFLAERGAREVVGVDISERMLELARLEWSHPAVTYRRDSIDAVQFGAGQFDVIVSSLAFHYIEDWPALCASMATWLAEDGVLAFSTEHPLYLSRKGEGWVRDATGAVSHWALDRYGTEGLREESWLVDGVRKYHRTFASILNGLTGAGFVVERVLEPMPGAEDVAARPEWANEARRPMFMLVRARRDYSS